MLFVKSVAPWTVAMTNLMAQIDTVTVVGTVADPTGGAVPAPKAEAKNEAIRVPGLWNLDVSGSKSFVIAERVPFQLRGDAFNSLNHTT